MNVILNTIIQPIKFIGFAGVGLFNLFKALGKSLSGKEDPLLVELRNEVSNALT